MRLSGLSVGECGEATGGAERALRRAGCLRVGARRGLSAASGSPWPSSPARSLGISATWRLPGARTLRCARSCAPPHGGVIVKLGAQVNRATICARSYGSRQSVPPEPAVTRHRSSGMEKRNWVCDCERPCYSSCDWIRGHATVRESGMPAAARRTRRGCRQRMRQRHATRLSSLELDQRVANEQPAARAHSMQCSN